MKNSSNSQMFAGSIEKSLIGRSQNFPKSSSRLQLDGTDDRKMTSKLEGLEIKDKFNLFKTVR